MRAQVTIPPHPPHRRSPRNGSAPIALRRLLSAIVLLTLWFSSRTHGATEFFVAPDGREANDGSRARPFATLEQARDAIRKLKSERAPTAGGITIWIRGGFYSLTQSFVLTREDSGEANAPITYRAWENELVRISGGRKVTDFRPVQDPAVRSRLPEKSRDHVLEADLRTLIGNNFGQLRSRGFGRAIAPAHLELFFDGQPMTLARWPNEGDWERIAGFPLGSSQGDDHGGRIGALPGGFHYSGDRPRSWKLHTNVWVHGYWAWDWANSYERISHFDLEQRHIQTAAPHGLYGFRKGQRFYFLNLLEELDQPGEWFLDHSNGALYFWPPKPVGSSETLISVLEDPLIALEDASHIAFRALRFEATRGDAIRVRAGSSNLIAGCTIDLIGNYGVRIDGGAEHRVVRCDIFNTGDGGVSLSGGDRQTLTPANHAVENCRFQKQGRWSKCYVPAVLLSGVGHRVAHNLIWDHPHCAILFTGNEHRIEWNEIHHVALETGDVGAIYTGRDWTFRGNVIRNNFIHHTGGVGMGSMGVYMDDCVSGTLIEGNIFYKVTRAVFLGGGRDHQVVNNVFVECNPAVQIDGRGLDKSPVWHNMVYDFMRKQLGSVPADLYRTRYPEIPHLDPYYQSTNGVPPEANLIAKNISVGGKWLQVGWHAQEKMLHLTNNYVGPDPGFASIEKLDFRLKENEVTRSIGFHPIPVEKIGPQP